MSRRKVVKARGKEPSRTSEADAENGWLPPDEVAGKGEDSLKLLWRDLMSDVGGLILSSFDADPHRFDEQKVDDRKASHGLAIVALLGGAAMLLALGQLVVG